MKKILLLSLLFFSSMIVYSQSGFENEPSVQFPFGRLNPDAPPQVGDFESMIGICQCKSLNRKPDQTWNDTLSMTWKFKYIMNGTAVQDEVWRDNELYAGSIRQFHQDSGVWIVSYFSYPAVPYTPGVWRGNKDGNDIVLFQDQKAPNGMEGDSRLTFFDMNDNGFSWIGEWISKDGQFVYPFWKIFCERRKE